jgi:hypothetical protein
MKHYFLLFALIGLILMLGTVNMGKAENVPLCTPTPTNEVNNCP